tara:strand:- start:5191 stop:7032 length:1842 start_codon:yes stop_codon:yes gene_type:complete
MAEDKKPEKEAPAPRTPKSTSDKILEKQKEVAQKQLDRQQIQIKLQEGQKKVDEAMNRGQTTLANSLSRAINGVKFALEKDPNNADLIADRLEESEDILSNVDKVLEAQEKRLQNDPVVRTLEDLIEENARSTKLLEADSTAQLDLQRQLANLNGRFSGLDESGRENAAMLQMQFEESSQALKDAIESGDMQAQDLAMKQLEQIKSSAESEENRREAQKQNELANSRLGQIAFWAEDTANKMDDAISGALAGAGVLAGLAGFALLFLDPEKFQEIMESLIDQVGGVIDLITGIITGDFSMVMSGLGDSWMLLSGVALALLPKVIGFIAKILRAIKLFQIFMMKTFIPGILSMYRSIMSSGPVIKLTNMLTKVGTAFKVFMMNAFIPGMVKFFVGMMTTLGAALKGVLAVIGPMLAPVAIITALVLGIAFGLKALSKALGFTSVFDMIFVMVAYLKDAFAHIVNAIGSIVNFILGIVEGVAGLLGFEIDLPQIPKMATDNAAKKKAEIKVKDAAKKEEELKAAAKKKEEEELAFATGADMGFDEMLEDSKEFDGELMNSQSFDNALEKANQGGGDSVVTSVKRDGDNISSVVTTTTISNPFSRASSVMEGVTSR